MKVYAVYRQNKVKLEQANYSNRSLELEDRIIYIPILGFYPEYLFYNDQGKLLLLFKKLPENWKEIYIGLEAEHEL